MIIISSVTIIAKAQVTDPIITFSENSGLGGVTVTLSGANFPASQSVAISYSEGTNPERWVVLVDAVTRVDGSFVVPVVIPDLGTFGAGDSVFEFTPLIFKVGTIDGIVSQPAVFNEYRPGLKSIGAQTAGGLFGNGTSINSIMSGDRIVGKYFQPNALIRIYLDNQQQQPVGADMSDASGYFETTVLMPSLVSIGNHQIIVEENYNSVLTINFTVVDTTAPVTRASGYDETRWYNSDIRITLDATDEVGGSGVKETYYKLNSGETRTVSINGQPVITTDGTTLEYWSVDNAGNEEIHHVLSNIKLDKTPPTGSLQISGGPYTSSQSVTLQLTAFDGLGSGVNGMRFSNDGVWDTETWEAYSSTKTWTLTSGDGPKIVYCQIRDNAGNIAQCQATIVLTTQLDGSITINGDAYYTRSITVTLSLSAASASGVNQMRFSTDNSTWSAWESYRLTKAYTLSGGDGDKTVYVQFRDNAGVTATDSSSIKLDTTAPNASAGQNRTVPAGSTVSFDGLASTDNMGIASYTWSFGDGTFDDGATPVHRFNDAGEYTVTLTVKDYAGNTAASSVTITVQGTAPTPTPNSNPTTAPTDQPTTSPPVSSSPTPTRTRSPTPSPNTQVVPATVDQGWIVDLYIGGNITSSQISGATLSSNTASAKTTLTFTLTGPANTTGFGNLTIPKTSIVCRAAPQVLIDGTSCPDHDHGYAEDGANYYVWWMNHFSTHQMSVVFEGTVGVDNSLWIYLISVVVLVIVALSAFMFLRSTKGKALPIKLKLFN